MMIAIGFAGITPPETDRAARKEAPQYKSAPSAGKERVRGNRVSSSSSRIGMAARKANRRKSPKSRSGGTLARLRAELAAARKRIARLEATANVDALTDVLNRRGFERELGRSLAYVQRYGTTAALIYLDLDRFKACNDRHGHAAGDALLKAVARALVREVRASDLVARLGGDEFAVLMWNVDAARAKLRARDLEAAIENVQLRREGARCSVGASAGLAMLKPAAGVVTTITAADKAMYVRKRERARLKR